MSEPRMLADVLNDYQGEKKSGVLFIAVKEKSDNLVRLFFHEGQIRHMSYGQCSGNDCLEILDCYEFTTAYFVKDMKAPAVPAAVPPTAQIIEQLRRSGRTVSMK